LAVISFVPDLQVSSWLASSRLIFIEANHPQFAFILAGITKKINIFHFLTNGHLSPTIESKAEKIIPVK